MTCSVLITLLFVAIRRVQLAQLQVSTPMATPALFATVPQPVLFPTTSLSNATQSTLVAWFNNDQFNSVPQPFAWHSEVVPSIPAVALVPRGIGGANAMIQPVLVKHPASSRYGVNLTLVDLVATSAPAIDPKAAFVLAVVFVSTDSSANTFVFDRVQNISECPLVSLLAKSNQYSLFVREDGCNASSRLPVIYGNGTAPALTDTIQVVVVRRSLIRGQVEMFVNGVLAQIVLMAANLTLTMPKLLLGGHEVVPTAQSRAIFYEVVLATRGDDEANFNSIQNYLLTRFDVLNANSETVTLPSIGGTTVEAPVAVATTVITSTGTTSTNQDTTNLNISQVTIAVSADAPVPGALIGGIVGGILGLLLLIIIVFVLLVVIVRNRRKRQTTHSNPQTADQDSVRPSTRTNEYASSSMFQRVDGNIYAEPSDVRN